MLEKLLILYFYLKTKYITRFKNKTHLRAWQSKKIQKFLKKITKQSKFYASIYNNFNNFDSDDNVINKKVMLNNFNDLNTANLKLGEVIDVAQRAENSRDFSPKIREYSVGLSSGTSGNRGVFVTSDYERAMWCGTMLAKLLPWSIFKQTKIAFFLRANNNLYETVGSKTLKFKFFDLKNDYNENLKKLNEYQADILVAPPAMLEIIAKAQEQKIISISPKKIVSVADVLYEDTKKYIERIFNQIVHQVYQATEGFLACTCKYGHLHLNEDMIYVRKKYLDEKRFIPIITDFQRNTQPIINYELNDILVEDFDVCPCGSPYTRLAKIEGRCDDILKFGNVVIFPDFIVRNILQKAPSVEKFQVVQVDDNTIELYLLADIDFESKSAILSGLIEFFKEKNIDINILVKIYVEEKDLTLKRKRVKKGFVLTDEKS